LDEHETNHHFHVERFQKSIEQKNENSKPDTPCFGDQSRNEQANYDLQHRFSPKRLLAQCMAELKILEYSFQVG
jgi:hypothetical protein